MGIEPTDHMISMQPYGFEDRGRHQPNKHFHIFVCSAIERLWTCLKVHLSRRPTTRFTFRERATNGKNRFYTRTYHVIYPQSFGCTPMRAEYLSGEAIDRLPPIRGQFACWRKL